MVHQLDMKKEIFAFVGIAFVLLGVLFGMQIMTFVFGNTAIISSSFNPASTIITNESGSINSSGHTLTRFSDPGFTNPSITLAINASNNTQVISAGNFTLNISNGVVTNSSATNFNFVNFTYTYNSDSDAKITADSVTNDSLVAIQTYTNQADTQFNTTAIGITLLVLIALFAIFWKVFMGKGGISGGNRNFS